MLVAGRLLAYGLMGAGVALLLLARKDPLQRKVGIAAVLISVAIAAGLVARG
jgi:hypothetical protein